MLGNIELKASLEKAIEKLQFTSFTPIQEKAIPLLLKNQNVILKAPTGTGKTYAFLIPILDHISQEIEQTQAIICVPTRELASQIERVAKELVTLMGENIDVYTLTGGRDRERSIEYLAKKQPQILIGTPGRLQDIIVKERMVDMREVRYIVFDETDMIIENGFIEALDEILESLVDTNDVTYAVASATVSQEVEVFIKKYIKNIQLIDVKRTDSTILNTKHLLLEVTGKDKPEMLLKVMGVITPYLALIFANTKKEVDFLTTFLKEKGYKVGTIHGDMKARERKQMIRRIESLEFEYVVASDIAARGIDIDGVSHVINYDVPTTDNIAFYSHRAGRTGRMNYDGVVITLFEKSEQVSLDKIAQSGVKFEQVVIKNGELVPKGNTRDKVRKEVDPKILAESQKAKKSANRKGKVKPGYKKRIKYAVQDAVRKEKRKTAKQNRKNNRRK